MDFQLVPNWVTLNGVVAIITLISHKTADFGANCIKFTEAVGGKNVAHGLCWMTHTVSAVLKLLVAATFANF